MSDIRFNQWLHNSGTGGISQDSAGHVGIGTTVPTHINALTNNNSILHVGIVSCNTLNAASKIEGSIDDWIIHQSDTNTKFGFPAVDTFSVETAGDERLRITSDGKIGIGDISNPGGLLTVYDGAAANDTPEILLSAFRPAIRFQDRSSSALDSEIVGDLDSLIFRISAEVDSDTALTEQMRLKSVSGSGYLGIGTHNPDQKLEVYNGAIKVDRRDNADTSNPHIDLRTGPAGASRLMVYGEDHTDDNSNWIYKTNANEDHIFHCGSTERLRIKSDGKVGVGTAAPDRDFEVYNTGSQTAIGIKGGTNTAQSSLWFMKPGDGNIGGIYYLHGSDDTQGFHFRANDNQVANIKGSGIVTVENTISGAGHTSGVYIFKASGSNDDHAELAVGYDRQNCYVIQRKRNSADIEIDTRQSGSNIQHEYQGATRWTESANGMINTYAAGGANFIGRWRYCQVNQSQNYEHHILGPDGTLLFPTYVDTNAHGIIWVGVTGTGTNSAYTQYRFSNKSNHANLSLTHLSGGSAANSNVPYIVSNSNNPAWKMDHSGTYTMVIDVMMFGGKSNNGTYSTDAIRGANP